MSLRKKREEGCQSLNRVDNEIDDSDESGVFCLRFYKTIKYLNKPLVSLFLII